MTENSISRTQVYPLPELQQITLYLLKKKRMSGITGPKLWHALCNRMESGEVKEATHYSNLRRLIERGWVKMTDVLDSQQRCYRITKLGFRALQESSAIIKKLHDNYSA